MATLTERTDYLAGSVVSHYRILRKLGGGAMGVVYQAEDNRLRRAVALKFLPARWSGDTAAKRRFVREARAASAIDHPNICTIHEIDETEDGELFIVMPYYTGETLKKRLERGPVSWQVAVGILGQILSGLVKAHGHGIVHRDLKPANLMITEDGTLKIVDFGLAKLASEAKVTGLGQALGTVVYMSPEQTLGRDLDARSDLWTTGVVLFEMLTGRCPFQGEPAIAMESIRTAKTPAPSDYREGIPADLERILHKALAKRRTKRYQSAQEMLADLAGLEQALAVGGDATLGYSVPAPDRWRRVYRVALLAIVLALVAVLAWYSSGPAGSGRGPPSAAADGRLRLGVLAPQVDAAATIPEDWPRLIQALLAAELTGAEEFGVVEPRTLNGLVLGAFETLDAQRGPAFFGTLERARLDLVLDGVLLGSEGGHRLVANLIETSSGEPIISTTTELTADEQLPDELRKLSAELMGHVEVQALGRARRGELQPWISPRRHDIDALRAFLQATEYIYRFEEGGHKYLERALEIDPDFVTARVWLISGLRDADAAQPHYEYLLELEPEASPFEQAMIGWVGALQADDVAAQIQHLEIALGHSPDNYILLANVADLRRETGDCEGALRDIAPAVAARWAFPPLYGLLGNCLIELGRFREARRELKAALSVEPVFPIVYAMLEALAVFAGDAQEADRYWRRFEARKRSRVHEPVPTEVALVYARTAARCESEGRLECAVRLLGRALQADPSDVELRARVERLNQQTGEAGREGG